MPKKKQPKNAFYFFMKDFKDDMEQTGYRFTNGMKEVAELAGPKWKELSASERLPYENMAAEHRIKDKGNKFTTMGISYAQLERDEMEKREADNRMKREIMSTVQSLDRDTTLTTHDFYFIHFNYYCRVDDGSYLACEVSVARFSLRSGVSDGYHAIIRHDRIPTGYTYAAKQHADDTHQIPLPSDLEEGEPYRGNIFISIKSFIDRVKMPNGDLPPLYTVDSHVDVAQSVLTDMAEFHYPQNPDIFRVYPLSKLFFHLRNAASPPGKPAFPVETLALRELDKDLYNFAPGISCLLHEKDDSCVYCSKSIVTRWGYLICDHCCKDLRIPVVLGQHVPFNADIKQKKQKEAMADDEFVTVRRGKSASSLSYANKCSPASRASGSSMPEPVPKPLQKVTVSKAGPSEERIHQYNLNTASVPKSPARTPDNCWGLKAEGPLRRPMQLPASVQDALNFSNEDFPDLGSHGSRSQGRMPPTTAAAAVAGRGRGTLRLFLDKDPPAPGVRREAAGAPSHAVMGRGMLRPDAAEAESRLAADLKDLDLE